MTPGASERPAPKAPPPGAGRARAVDDALGADEVEVLLRVGDMLRRLRFGTVLLTVQDGKVVQIETAEKFRL